MKTTLLIAIAGLMMAVKGCSKQTAENKSPAFMFWCFREEVVSSDLHVPDMTTPAEAAYLQNRLKTIPGFERSRCDLENHTLTVSYQSSTTRKMNFEEAIALSGFSVNGRPANPRAKIPEGVK